MQRSEQLDLLRRVCAERSQSAVARAIGYSASTINQALKGTYKGDLGNVLLSVEAKFGASTLKCPVMGEITLGVCIEHRGLPFAATNPMRVRLYRACRVCPHNPSTNRA